MFFIFLMQYQLYQKSLVALPPVVEFEAFPVALWVSVLLSSEKLGNHEPRYSPAPETPSQASSPASPRS